MHNKIQMRPSLKSSHSRINGNAKISSYQLRLLMERDDLLNNIFIPCNK